MSSSRVLKVYKKENGNSDDQNILRVQNLFSETKFVQKNQNILKPKVDESWCRRMYRITVVRSRIELATLMITFSPYDSYEARAAGQQLSS